MTTRPDLHDLQEHATSAQAEATGEPGGRLVELLMMLLPPSTDSDDVDRLAKPLLGFLANETAAAEARGYRRGWDANQAQHEQWAGAPRMPRVPCTHCKTDALKCAVQPSRCCAHCFHHEETR